MKTLNLKAIRTNLSCARWVEKMNKGQGNYDSSQCVDKEVDVVVEYGMDGIRENPIVGIKEGGVTGYEQFYVSDVLARPLMGNVGMSWCAGTPGRWDRLWMPHDQVDILIKALREEYP